MIDEHRAVFLGKDTIWIGSFQDDGNSIKPLMPHKFIPWKKEPRALIGNIREHLGKYTERKLIDLRNGRTEKMVRVYHFDIDTYDEYLPDLHTSGQRELASLRVERDYLFQRVMELEDMLRTAGMGDLLKKKIKTETTFFGGLNRNVMVMKDKEKKQIKR